MTYDVFISYSRKDTAIADRICEAFDREGIKYFIDRRNIVGSEEYLRVLSDAIDESRIFLFLASENSYKAKFTGKEVAYAIDVKKKNVLLPYFIDKSEMPRHLRLSFADLNIRNIKEHPIEPTLVDDVLSLLGRSRRMPPTETLSPPKPPVKRLKPRRLYFYIAAAILVGVLIVLAIKQEKRPSPKVEKTEEERNNDGIRMDGDELVFLCDGTEYHYKMVYVDGGTYTMGCTFEQGDDCFKEEKPAHSVTVDSFYIGQTEVTQALWKAVMGSEPKIDYYGGWEDKYGRGANYPAYFISYGDVKTFINTLNSLTCKNFRLPTEEEWEFAARGGNSSWGYKYSGSDNPESVAWYSDNSGSKSHPVAQKQANELGLYDMSGNVYEWCISRWCSDYNSVRSDPTRVSRGGCWYGGARDCRVSSRNYDDPSGLYYYLGFRLALSR